MPEPIRPLTLSQFALLLDAFVRDGTTRRLSEVHLHHTWRPRHADFRGRHTIEAMRRVHMDQNHWADIAQHLTIDPAGGLWTGRSWNARPASQSGRNGAADAGPFMIEMIGDFDDGQDRFDGPQKSAAIEVVATILAMAGLGIEQLCFHRELGSPKSCPGRSIDKATLAAEVDHRRKAIKAARPRGAARDHASPFDASFLLGPSTLRAADDANEPASLEVPEHRDAGEAVDRLQRAAVAPARNLRDAVSASDDRARTAAEWLVLRPHVVNLSKGRLSTGGEFDMDASSFDVILAGLRQYARTTAQPRLLLYAHGGLVSEKSALGYARATYQWWLDHGVYPVYFVWETGPFEIIRQGILGPRGIGDWWDERLEELMRPGGLPLWTAMKESALASASPDTGDGWPGGAWLFVNALRAAADELTAAGHPVTLHTAGHSAGAIFQAHLIPALLASGLPVETLAFLAPAIRVDRFKQHLASPITNGEVKRFSMFTMSEDAELADNVGPYRKSLLYLVSRACEPRVPTPILGLQENIDADAELPAFFRGANVELQHAVFRDLPPNPLTRSTTHGGFDNDRATMSSVLRRIKQVPDSTLEGLADFPEFRAFDVAAFADAAPVPVGGDRSATAGAGARRALCVGIDHYRDRPLSGCVNDATAWATALQRLGFTVERLFDGQATRGAIMSALDALVTSARPGDTVVFQYAGHGTQIADRNGDEGDGFDEAFVPVDYDLGRFLLDDDVAAIAAKLTAGAQLTLFMDCCHSGTISRFSPAVAPRLAADERVRYLPMSAELQRAHDEFRAVEPTGSAPEGSLPGVIHFAACRDEEYAYESNGHGDFTVAGTALLEPAVERQDTHEQFIEAIRTELARRGRQHPGLMPVPAGLERRPLLGGASRTAAPSRPAQGDDAALLAQVEAMAATLRERMARAAQGPR